MTCQLYRHFDANGGLLYVGISGCAWSRLANGHRKTSPWFQLIFRVEIEAFETRKAALAAEAKAIQIECPQFNKTSGNIGENAMIGIGIRMSQPDMDWLDRLAKAKGCTRSVAIREMIRHALMRDATE